MPGLPCDTRRGLPGCFSAALEANHFATERGVLLGISLISKYSDALSGLPRDALGALLVH